MSDAISDRLGASSAEGLCYTEEQASEAIDRMLAADEGGAWLFDLGPLGAGYAIVRDLPFSAEDEDDFRRRTADLLSVGAERFTVRRMKKNHAMKWRFEPLWAEPSTERSMSGWAKNGTASSSRHLIGLDKQATLTQTSTNGPAIFLPEEARTIGRMILTAVRSADKKTKD